MVIAIVLTGFCVIGALFGALFVVRRAYEREKQAFIMVLRSYFESNTPENPSEFSRTICQIADVVIGRALATFKAQQAQALSVMSRNAKSIEAEAMKDIASAENPMLGAALEAFPNLSKLISKKPVLMNLAIPLLARFGGGGNSAAKSGDNGKSGVKFNL